MKVLVLVAALLLPLGGLTYYLISGHKTQRSPGRDILVIEDLSVSTSSHRESDWEDFTKKVLPNCRGGDKLSVANVTHHTLPTADPIEFLIPNYNPLRENLMQYQSRLTKLLEEIKRETRPYFFTVYRDSKGEEVPETDLLAVGQLAWQLFSSSGKTARSERLLVLFSDGIHQSKDLDFTSEKLDEDRTSEIIDQLRSDEALPNLVRVKVWMAGAGANAQLSKTKLRELERFWLRYFAACKASFPKHRYATRLLDFPP